METKEPDVEAFLNDFKVKMNVFSVVYTDREKNLQGLFDLEIRSIDRTEVLKSLMVKDYYKGPTKDNVNGPDYWEFGRIVNRKEAYIKITMGNENRPVICISFHLAERAIVYPFK